MEGVTRQINHFQSNLVFVEDHIGDSIDNGILSLAVGAYELSLDNMSLHG